MSEDDVSGCTPWSSGTYSRRDSDVTSTNSSTSSRLAYKGPRPLRTSDISRVLVISANNGANGEPYGGFHEYADEDFDASDRTAPFILSAEVLDGFPMPPTTMPNKAFSKKAFAASTGDLLPPNPAFSNPVYTERLRFKQLDVERKPLFIHRQPLQRNQDAMYTTQPLHIRSKASTSSMSALKNQKPQNFHYALPDGKNSSATFRQIPYQSEKAPSIRTMPSICSIHPEIYTIPQHGSTYCRKGSVARPPSSDTKSTVTSPSDKYVRQRFVSAPNTPLHQLKKRASQSSALNFPEGGMFGSVKTRG